MLGYVMFGVNQIKYGYLADYWAEAMVISDK